MRKLPIAAAALAALITVSVLSANAEPSDVSTPAEEDQIHYCRTLLGDEEQLIYDALLECALSEDPSETGEEIRIRTDPSGEEFKKAFRRSYNALLYDHPELFWLAVSDSAFQYSYHRQLLERDYYRLAFKINGEFPGRNSQVKALEKAAEEFLDGIDLEAPAPEVALEIHDKLIDLVTYDKEAAERVDREYIDRDLAHTAYGALVENSSCEDNTAVCDGYSYAYEYLLQKAGIRSTIVAGRAGETEETAGSHSWNLVELDGEWYEVDTTWDDISVEEALDTEEDYSEIAEEALRNKWFTDKLTHFMFNVTTEKISDFEPGKYYRYTNDRGWVSFLGPSVHIRYTEEEAETTGDYMSPLAPLAEGTQYSYEALTKD